MTETYSSGSPLIASASLSPGLTGTLTRIGGIPGGMATDTIERGLGVSARAATGAARARMTARAIRRISNCSVVFEAELNQSEQDDDGDPGNDAEDGDDYDLT